MYNDTRLGPVETALVAAWARSGKRSVTAQELRDEIGTSANGVIKRLVGKGLLERVGRGSYVIHPIRVLARRQATSSIVAVSTLMADQLYYVGGRWAWSHHHFTQQVYVSVLDVFTVTSRRNRHAGFAAIEFHMRPLAAFEYGIDRVTIEGIDVPISDPSRTVLDALDLPSIFGNGELALREVGSALGKADPEQLIRYAIAGARLTTCQRLGVLLERDGTAVTSIDDLHRHVARRRSLTAMIRGKPRRGPINQRWRVIENDLE